MAHPAAGATDFTELLVEWLQEGLPDVFLGCNMQWYVFLFQHLRPCRQCWRLVSPIIVLPCIADAAALVGFGLPSYIGYNIFRLEYA